MIKLRDLPEDFYLDYYRQLPQIDERDVRLLWHNDYYDGPLNGILLYQGKMCWFQIFHALRTDEVRSREDKDGIAWNDHFVRYLLVELSEEQVKEEKYWHELFQKKVSTRSDYDENGHRKTGEVKPKEMWNEFYEPYKMRKPSDLSNNLVLGWFQTVWGSIKQDEENEE
jgi:hypothetical protein